MLFGSTTSEENVKRVSAKLQKRAARVILDADVGVRSEMLFRRLDWLPLKDELNLQKTSLILKCIKDENSCPSDIAKLLTKNSDRHNRTSRHGRYKLVCPTVEKQKGYILSSQWSQTLEQHSFRYLQEGGHLRF